MALDAILFDVDGTLVDANEAHVETWRRVLASHGFVVAADRIFAEIGKGGDKLVPSLLGRRAEDEHGKAMRAEYPAAYAKRVGDTGLRPLPGAADLVKACRGRGLKTVLVTSSDKGYLRTTMAAAGTDFTQLVDLVVTGEDANESKPAPDLVAAAVRKLGMTPAQCVMVGDTPYDALACRDAGVVCVGVTCGGHAEAELRFHGARLVYRDPADVLAHLDDALVAASPGNARLTAGVLDRLMRDALAVAEDGARHGEAPIGCVLARGDGTIIARGYNQLVGSQDKTAHAEMVAFRAAAGRVPADARDLFLVSTLEPCVMCTGAAMEAAVDTVVYALPAPADAGTARVNPPRSPESQVPRVIGRVLEAQSRALFELWLPEHRDHPGAAYVGQLLGEIGKVGISM